MMDRMDLARCLLREPACQPGFDFDPDSPIGHAQGVEEAFLGVGELGEAFRGHRGRGSVGRLVVAVRYTSTTLFIRFVGTHAEYDRIDAETV